MPCVFTVNRQTPEKVDFMFFFFFFFNVLVSHSAIYQWPGISTLKWHEAIISVIITGS